MLARWLVLVVLSACGRFGFAALGDGVDAGGADATGDDALPAPPPGFVVSRTQLSTFAPFSWVALDVDWARSLAYVGTREAGHCVAIIDFANEAAPSLLRWIDAPGTACLEVALLDPGRLAVISTAASALSLWSLGPDPGSAAPTLLDQQMVNQPRHFSVDRSGGAPRLLVTAMGSLALSEYEVTATGLVFIDSWPGACAEPYQAVVVTEEQIVVGCQINNSPIEILSRDFMPIAELPNTGSGATGSWTGAALADGRAVVLGWANVVVRGAAIVTRWQTAEAYRHVVAAGPDTVWAAVGDGSLEVLSLATDGVARVIGRSSLGTGREAYAVRLAPDGRRGIAVTNRGHFVVFDPAQITQTDITYP